MKIILTAITILTANLAIAETPNVICELGYSRSSYQGDVDMQSRTVKPEIYKTVKAQLKGFELNVSIVPKCIPDGTCTGKFEIISTLSKNSVSTTSSKELKEQYDRHSAQLTVGDKKIYANCDVQ